MKLALTKPWAFSLVAFLLSGCAFNEEVRTAGEGANPGPTPSYQSIETYRIIPEAHQEDSLFEKKVLTAKVDQNKPLQHQTAYIEFDEQGDFLDRNQLIEALAHTPTSSRRLLLFYAHGWQNNTRSDDVSKFNQFLYHLNRTLAVEAAHQGTAPWQVYGVYVAWRGSLFIPSATYPPHVNGIVQKESAAFQTDDQPLSTALSVPKVLTFWSRKAAAGRFAGGPLLETIQALSNKVRIDNPNHVPNLNTRVILIGHSFGAYIVEKTLLESLTAQAALQDSNGTTSYITPPADFVVLLNSAAPSIYAKELIDFLKWHAVGEKNSPFIVSVSSENDIYTKDFFPAGTVLQSGFDIGSYQNSQSVDYHGANQKYFFTHTPGHTLYLPSYDARPCPATPNLPTVDPSLTNNGSPDEWLISRNLFPENYTNLHLDDSQHEFLAWGAEGYGKTTGAISHAQLWKLAPILTVNPGEARYNDTAYWIVRVPKEIIADHGDVWSSNSVNLVSSLFRMSGLVSTSSALRTLTVHPVTQPVQNTLTKCRDFSY